MRRCNLGRDCDNYKTIHCATHSSAVDAFCLPADAEHANDGFWFLWMLGVSVGVFFLLLLVKLLNERVVQHRDQKQELMEGTGKDVMTSAPTMLFRLENHVELKTSSFEKYRIGEIVSGLSPDGPISGSVIKITPEEDHQQSGRGMITIARSAGKGAAPRMDGEHGIKRALTRWENG